MACLSALYLGRSDNEIIKWGEFRISNVLFIEDAFLVAFIRIKGSQKNRTSQENGKSTNDFEVQNMQKRFVLTIGNLRFLQEFHVYLSMIITKN